MVDCMSNTTTKTASMNKKFAMKFQDGKDSSPLYLKRLALIKGRMVPVCTENAADAFTVEDTDTHDAAKKLRYYFTARYCEDCVCVEIVNGYDQSIYTENGCLLPRYGVYVYSIGKTPVCTFPTIEGANFEVETRNRENAKNGQ